MKKKILLILLIILTVVTVTLLSCNQKACPTYGGKNVSNGIYSHLKPGR